MKTTVLIIEDNEQNMYLMTFILENAGYTVIQARDGKAGIRLAQEAKPDLVLLDIQLPEMDGYQVATALRSDAALATVPIIAVTSYAMPGDKERIIAAGATGYIEKPINPNMFVPQLQEHLSPFLRGKEKKR